MEKTFLEMMAEEIKYFITNAEETLANLYETREEKMEIAAILDGACVAVEAKPTYVWIGRETVEITFTTEEEASNFVHSLIDYEDASDKFMKALDGWSSQPKWYWDGKIKKMHIKVMPATPKEGCVLKGKSSVSMHWYCEKEA